MKDPEKFNEAFAIMDDLFETTKRIRWDKNGDRLCEKDPKRNKEELKKKKKIDVENRKIMEDLCEELGISYPELLREILHYRLIVNGRYGVDRKF